MNKLRLYTALLLVLALVPPSLAADPADAVKRAYEELKAGLQQGSGKVAADLVTSETLAFYERGRQLALSSENIDLEAISQTEVILMFQLRYLSSKDELEKMNGRDVFAWSIEKGLVKKETIAALTLDQVQVEGTEAFATLRKEGKPVHDLAFRFKKQNKN